MEKNNEKPAITGNKQVRDEKGRMLPGTTLNPNGRPKGSEDFKTKFYKMVDKIAKNNNMTPDEIEEQLFMVGYKKAKDGDYSFYRDLMDRVHGRPINKNELTGAGGEALNIIFSKEFDK
jgi:hypothetical protein